MTSVSDSERKNLFTACLAILILIAGVSLRILYLTADPPRDITISGGIIGDPGQYQYGARNQVLFNQPVLDGFAPHLFSPLIHPLNIWIYNHFGINLTTHRLMPLVFSILILVFFWIMLHRLLDGTTALLATAFLAFSYPILVYSHVAYREYPMTFFCMLSFWAFAKGAESAKTLPFAYSGLFFILSFFSKGSGIFLLGVFFGVGIVWLFEKRIRLRQLITFFITLCAGFLSWWLLIFKPNQGVLKTLLADNSNVRRIESLTTAFHNLWESPLMMVLRNDPVLFVVAAVSLFWMIRKRFSRPNTLPPIVDMAFAWLAVGTLFHGIVNYRPTRFFLMLVPPIALIAGFGLNHLLNRRIDQRNSFVSLLAALPVWTVVLIAMGFPAYLSTASLWTPANMIFHALLLGVVLYLFFHHTGKRVRIGLVFLVVVSSIYCNTSFYLRWVRHRQYEIPAIIEILNKSIPPARIAGNWAAHLSIGTPHRTYFAWPGFFNWQKDFLSRNRIDYLLLARHRNFDEISFYRNFFVKEWARTMLMAEFDLHNAKVQLLRILPENGISTDSPRDAGFDFEMESLPRSTGHVRFDPSASQKMTLVVSGADRFDIRLPELVSASIRGIEIRAHGRFSLQMVKDQQALNRILINASKPGLQDVHRDFLFPLDLRGEDVSLSFEALDKGSTVVLDRISLIASEEK